MTDPIACARCGHDNDADARFCSACGAPLRRTRDDAASSRRRPRAPSTTVGAPAPAAADLTLTLRPLDPVSSPVGGPAAPPPAAAAGAEVAGDRLIRSDPEEFTPFLPLLDDAVLPVPPVRPVLPVLPVPPVLPVLADAVPPALARSVAKANRRAEVRRARIAVAAQPAAATIDVLVLDGSDADRDRLSQLLGGFGFRIYPLRTAVDAMVLLAAKPFAAAFLNLAFHGEQLQQAQALCKRAKAQPVDTDSGPPVLVVVADRERAVDRVRAELVGADAFLVKPLQRGDVVRALEDGGVPLPRDERGAYQR